MPRLNDLCNRDESDARDQQNAVIYARSIHPPRSMARKNYCPGSGIHRKNVRSSKAKLTRSESSQLFSSSCTTQQLKSKVLPSKRKPIGQLPNADDTTDQSSDRAVSTTAPDSMYPTGRNCILINKFCICYLMLVTHSF